eukprot:m.308124 g.308124  ORF g.308124 m.308124 type:complete len:503 (+) comp43416_c0_seq1:22-1530(+)
METLVEQQRRYHEERERLEDAMVQEKLLKKPSVREQINSEHRVKDLLSRSKGSCKALVELYEDEDGSRKEEIQSLSGPNELNEFYDRFRQLKDFHRKYPGEMLEPMQLEFMRLAEARKNPSEDHQNLVDFSDEEGYGKYLDLHQLYVKFVNIKGMEKMDYLKYLNSFGQLFDISKEKKSHDYSKYLDHLLDYLYNYCGRVKPLMTIDKEIIKATKDFEIQWATGTFPGWKKDSGSVMAKAGARLDLSGFDSSKDLALLGLDRLKSALVALGLKCGGTLQERAERLFSTKGKDLKSLPATLFAKGRTAPKDVNERNKEMAYREAQIYFFVEVLADQKKATRDNVERKQARTAGELEEEEEDEEQVPASDSDSDEGDAIPYNPKNLPLGWDGKPIPYWLYKLHGLNLYYECEVCGNYRYRGPKAFQRHFSEWRHAHGMRCLGIPNTAHFANIISIAEAQQLWSKLKMNKEKERWQADREEEFEDSLGNVVTRKTYEDLRKQGLL